MPDYKNGKIYTIRNKNDDKLIYVGSTCKKYLSDRIANHRALYKRNPITLFYNLVEDWNDWYIELYENYPCNSKDELTKREGEVIREIGTLNKRRAGLNLPNGDKTEYQKEYNKIRDKTMKSTQDKKYRENNKEKIAEKRKEKITCECGSILRKDDIAKHHKSIKHQDWLKNNNLTIN
jgi:hypothetical protein